MFFKYFIIGLVQGITEFLPVSSSGHIVLISEIFNIDSDIILLSVVVHIATLISVIICMRDRIKNMIKNPFSKMTRHLIIATIPAVVSVILFHDVIDKLFGPKFLVYGFLITGILLILADMTKHKGAILDKKRTFLMGITQAFAILPGISRSGSTFAIGMMSGLEKEDALEFSFLMSIPIILGSAIWESAGLIGSGIEINIFPLIIAFITALVSGILSIKLMKKVVNSNKLSYFAIYIILISIVTIFVVFK